MLTALLDKIIKSNDRLALMGPDSNNDLLMNKDNSMAQSVLSFRGKHIPQISLEQYFQRIQKYCPITNDVFISLLVYFDRISKRCNNCVPSQDNPDGEDTNNKNGNDNDNNNDYYNSNINNSSNNSNNNNNNSSNNNSNNNSNSNNNGINEKNHNSQHQQLQIFVMDSYNIHRLIIAGVTVSTKFFSDLFYSNSRYARVGGISLQELNNLELQFLLMCDFHLLISVEELQRYADLLARFWQNNLKTNENLN
ncbi:hypothetical protein Kpol_1033p13 [Vanderwaltozyma polyspora DSM 70294]|uniref:Cyclin n=1 Tax=Vanderwaltozyma polyspora (strain ATCC 22028 / DSM 70294 / BCRC 21397 / CBS 2163 / NBRC 10782 / NRRL Y-8283 / UCD 57-17) TaxID=436907 RepID=A7TJ11_VANPO|nr:uncharacterized protein Kpol_1033p13 [Vanderwaltozyma polyspora DSM 70294]EDO17710.1 hypothetical protein Kpol_1033p13 [Vanderwaltozyma polyspora DSM 70294]